MSTSQDIIDKRQADQINESNSSNDQQDSGNVKVIVRVRPMSQKELSSNSKECIRVMRKNANSNIVHGYNQVNLENLSGNFNCILLDNHRNFQFDQVYPSCAGSENQLNLGARVEQQKQIYSQQIIPLLDQFIDGYNCSVLAYGQTCSGKTYTMGTGFEWLNGDFSNNSSDIQSGLNQNQNSGYDIHDDRGILPRAIIDLFRLLEESSSKRQNVQLSVCFLELYNELLIDLLAAGGNAGKSASSGLNSNGHLQNNVQIQIRQDENGFISWTGAKYVKVSSANAMMELLRQATLARTTASTGMNVSSSRSHAIFSILLEQNYSIDSSNDNLANPLKSSELKTVVSKFHFVDLAGSERMKRTKATGSRAKEGISINSGLLAMGKVIHALTMGPDGKRAVHVPYRDSKLTRLLQDSLGGNSKTLMVACISSSDSDKSESLNTLSYASRAKNIQNGKVRILAKYDSDGRDSWQVGKLKAEIGRLKMELLAEKRINRALRNNPSFEKGSLNTNLENENERPNDMLVLQNRALAQEVGTLKKTVKYLKQKLHNSRESLSQIKAERDSLILNNSHGGSSIQLHPVVKKYTCIIDELEDKLSFMELEEVNSSNISENISLEVNETDQNTLLATPINDQRMDNPTESNRSNSSEVSRSYEESPRGQLKSIQNDIIMREELVLKLEESSKEVKSLRENYEKKLSALYGSIVQLQNERDEALRKSNDANTAKSKKGIEERIKVKYEDKIKKLSSEMSDLRHRHNRSQQELTKKRRMNDNILQGLKAQIESLKKEKAKILDKLKDKEQALLQTTAEKDREIANLRRKERQLLDKTHRIELANQQMRKLRLDNSRRNTPKSYKFKKPVISSPSGKRSRKRISDQPTLNTKEDQKSINLSASNHDRGSRE